jgi:hypothetical protein
MRRRVVVAVGLLAMLACACGSSSNKGAQARATMTQACEDVARVVLSKDPKSGIPKMSLSQAVSGLESANATAHTAASLDPRWSDGAAAIGSMMQAMQTKSYAELDTAFPRVERVCGPLLVELG